MLFNSYTFLFVYLPIALLGYEICGHFHRRAVVLWLGFISLVFYAYWRPPFVLVLLSSITINYVAAALISGKVKNPVDSRVWLWIAIVLNLDGLSYFKYLFPLLDFFSRVSGSSSHWTNVVLPLGISFFTFTQIAYLVDLQQGVATFQDLSSYVLFVTFFPHLIAGPILHHKQMMPQFQQDRQYLLRLDDVAVGLSWFVMGLGKKVLLADTFAVTANLGYKSAGGLGLMLAWRTVLCFALQLYFDFSGYSDMALGLARMFSINFPLNFSSPYKSKNIIDFWQRWHITLTDYITDYVYSPLQFWISRRRMEQGKKVTRKALATPEGFVNMVAFPTLFTMFIAGVWHGAGLKFIVFGLLHGTYLTLNHAWRFMRHKSATQLAALPPPSPFQKIVVPAFSTLITFVAVVASQTFFRGDSIGQALSMLHGMAGLSGLGRLMFPGENSIAGAIDIATLMLGFAIVWGLPNTQQVLSRFKPALGETTFDTASHPKLLSWSPKVGWAFALGCLFFISLVHLEDPSTFLYFQF